MASEKNMRIILAVLLTPLILALLTVIFFPVLTIICPYLTARCVGECPGKYCFFIVMGISFTAILIGLLRLTSRKRYQ